MYNKGKGLWLMEDKGFALSFKTREDAAFYLEYCRKKHSHMKEREAWIEKLCLQ